jgi:hypothetical protein
MKGDDMEEDDVQRYLADHWNPFLATRNLAELLILREEMQDVVIEYVALLRTHGMKTKLRKTWAELLSE